MRDLHQLIEQINIVRGNASRNLKAILCNHKGEPPLNSEDDVSLAYYRCRYQTMEHLLWFIQEISRGESMGGGK